MYIQLDELQVISDTLMGSLRIRDNGNLFHFSREHREMVVNALLKRMGEITIDVVDENVMKKLPETTGSDGKGESEEKE